MAEPLRVAQGCDDHAHRVLMEKLVDTALGDDEDLASRRTYVGDGCGAPFLNLSRRPARPTAPSGRPMYRKQRIGAEPAGYAVVFIEAAQELAPHADAILILADADADDDRAAHAVTARDELRRRGMPRVALGVCDPIAEAWLVALLAPARPQRARQLQRHLSLDLARQPEQLCRAPSSSERHAKRALAYLLDDAHDDPMRYKADTPKANHTEPALAPVALDPRALGALSGCGLAGFFEQLTSLLGAHP